MGVDCEMFVRTKTPVTPAQVRRWAYELVSAFGTDLLWVTRPGESTFDPEGRHALEIIDKHDQDGPTILPRKGETFIRARLWTRYYGKGYERGNLPAILAIADW